MREKTMMIREATSSMTRWAEGAGDWGRHE
jgi:hypothetical protein